MIRYVFVDQDGVAQERSAPVYTEALARVGPEGWDRVRLDPNRRMAGFVNDCGHLSTEYRRNVVGSLLLMAYGANHLAYAGPVVVTGWDDHADGIEVCGLTEFEAEGLVCMVNTLRAALGLPAGPAYGPIGSLLDDPEWVEITREMAADIEAAASPAITVLTDNDALAALLSKPNPGEKTR